MKKVLLSLAVAAASLTASAQTVVFENNFNVDIDNIGLYDLDGDGDDVRMWAAVPTWLTDNLPVFEGGMLALDATELTVAAGGNGYQNGGTFDYNLAETATGVTIPAGNYVATLNFDLFVYPTGAEDVDDVIGITIYDNNTDYNIIDQILVPVLTANDYAVSVDVSVGVGQNYIYEIGQFDDLGVKSVFMIDNLVISYETALSVKELNNGEFAVYPNPAVNELTIANTNALAINTVNVLDITGKTVKTFNFNGSKVSQTVSIADLNTGVYFVQVNATEGTSVLRVAKK